MQTRTFRILAIGPLLLAALPSCTSNRDSSMALQCKDGLSAAYREMNEAEANGFRGAVGITKAASLLAAAKVQSEFTFPAPRNNRPRKHRRVHADRTPKIQEKKEGLPCVNP